MAAVWASVLALKNTHAQVVVQCFYATAVFGNEGPAFTLLDYKYIFFYLELITVEIKLRNSTVIVPSCYRPPYHTKYHQFIDTLCGNFSRLTSNVNKVTICRNFNLDWLKLQTDSPYPTSTIPLTPFI